MMLARLLGIDVPRIKRRGGFAVVAAMIAAILAILAIGFASLAGHIALSRRFDPEIAALIVAGTLMVLAVIALFVARQVLHRTQRELKSAVASSAAIAFVPTAASMATKHTRLAAVIGLAGVGFWLARNGFRR